MRFSGGGLREGGFSSLVSSSSLRTGGTHAPMIYSFGLSRLGDVIGNYRIVRVLGEGGAGMVYEVEHVRLGRKKAMKLLHADVPADFVARFFNEARAVNTIRHPNIIDIEDFVTLESGESFTVMDPAWSARTCARCSCARAGSRRRAPPRSGRRSRRRSPACTRSTSSTAISSPRDVFLETQGAKRRDSEPKLLDLRHREVLERVDRAHARRHDDGHAERHGARADHRRQASRHRGGPVRARHGARRVRDRRAGVRRQGQARAKVLRAHCYDAPVPPSERRGEPVGAVLESIILRCLSKAPEDRFAERDRARARVRRERPVRGAAAARARRVEGDDAGVRRADRAARARVG